MDKIKFAVPALALLGIVAIFLPWVSMGEASINFLDMFKGDMTPKGPMVLVFLGLGLPLILGGLKAGKGLGRGVAIVCAIGFILALLPTFKTFGVGAIGAKLLVICAALGAILSIVKIAKPDTVAKS